MRWSFRPGKRFNERRWFMEIVRFEDAPVYTAPNHDDVTARRLQGGEASSAGFVLVGHSFLPDGAFIPMDAAPIAKVYVVLDGAITIEQSDGATHVLRRLDSIHVAAGEARAVRNESGMGATMMVITPVAPA
jgi:quercetin dioxygenase-like cupin family protein